MFESRGWAQLSTPPCVNRFLPVGKRRSGDSITAGSNISYSVVLENPGPDAASNVQVTDAVPANTTFLSGQQDAGLGFTCAFPEQNASSGAMTCTIASFPAGGKARFTLV